MRTKLISKSVVPVKGYEKGPGSISWSWYQCPCGKDRVVEEHDDIPGYEHSYVWITCPDCWKKYCLDTSGGVENWELVEKTEEEN